MALLASVCLCLGAAGAGAAGPSGRAAPSPTLAGSAPGPATLLTAAQRTIGAGDPAYRVRRRGPLAVARGGGLTTTFGPSGPAIAAPGGTLSLRLARVGRAGSAAAPPPASPRIDGNVVRYRRGALVEWYRTGPLGLEQGFTVRAAWPGTGPLTLALSVAGSLRARVADGGVAFVSRSGAVRLRYGALRVTDAAGDRFPRPSGSGAAGCWCRCETAGRATRSGSTRSSRRGRSWPAGGGAPGRARLERRASADGRTALIGAPNDDSPAFDSAAGVLSQGAGAVWVFTRSGSSWRQQGRKLVGNGERGPAQFGDSVALSNDGDTALVGAPADDGGRGAAWVFTRRGFVWGRQGRKLVAAGTGGAGGLGVGVALSGAGNLALVGAGSADGGVGAVWTFARSGAAWRRVGGPLTGVGEVGAGRFGDRVALSDAGTVAVVAAPADDNRAGAVWIFARSGPSWSPRGPKLVGAGESEAGLFGAGVALSADGRTALVGAPLDAGGAGAAWVFARSGDRWAPQGGKLAGGGEFEAGQFGGSVALSAAGGAALVGGSTDAGGVGAAWAFARSGESWTAVGGKLTPRDAAGAPVDFGTSVALSADGRTALVGGLADHDYVGAAWAFRR